MSRKYPRRNRPLTVAIKGRSDEMPPEHGGVMEINGKRYRVRRTMKQCARNAQTVWKEYTLEPISEAEANERTEQKSRKGIEVY